MTFSQSIKTCFAKKYATFSGRASRSEYWYFVLFNFLINVVFEVLACIFMGAAFASNFMTGRADFGEIIAGPFLFVFLVYLIYSLACIIPGLAVTVRRLHDTGRSGWWWWICLIPFFGPICLFVFMVLDSQHAPNKYGLPEA